MDDRLVTGRDLHLGRAVELADLRARLDRTVGGGGHLVLISGEAGIGKTRLAEEFAGFAHEAGAAVCWGAGVEDDAAPQYWPWIQALRHSPDDVQHVLRVGVAPAQAELLAVLTDDVMATSPRNVTNEGAEPGHQRFRLFHAVSSALREAGMRRPLVVILDDLHWADDPSVFLMEFLARELRGSRVLLLGCHRSLGPFGEDGSGLALGRLTRIGSRTQLSGLEEADALELIQHTAGVPLRTDLARSLFERTAGNPFYLKEVVRLLDAQGRLSDEYGGADALPALPRTVQEAIDQRLARLSSTCVETLTRASVIGTAFDGSILEATTGCSRSEIAELLDEAVRSSVVTPFPGTVFRYRFAHPLIREALYAELSSLRRAELHRQVGQAFEARVVDPVTHLSALAHHYHQAASVGEGDKALQYAERAGHHALATLSYEGAARHFWHAIQLVELLGKDEAHRVELLLALGDSRLRAGDWPGSVQAYEDAAASARRRGWSQELARAALGLGAGGSGVEVRLLDQSQIDLLREALEGLGADDTSLRSWILGRLSVATAFVEPSARRRAWSLEAAEIGRRIGDSHALAHALAGYCDAISPSEHAEERLEAATEIVALAQSNKDRDMELLGRRLRTVALLEVGDVSAVDREIDAFERVATALRQPLYRWYVPLWRGMRAVMEGRLDDCARHVGHAREIGRQANSRNAHVLTLALDLWRLLESGHAQEACAQHERSLGERETGYNQPLFRTGFLARAGRHQEARALLASLAAGTFRQVDTDDAAAVAGLCFAADAAVDLGDHAAAALLYEHLRPHARRFAVSGIGAACLGSVAVYLGSLAHVLGNWDAAEEHFHSATDAHRRSNATLLLAHTQRRHASMLLDHPEADKGRAAALLREATLTYRRLGLDHWTTRATESSAEGRPSAAATREPHVFFKEGDLWTLRFAGAEARVKHVKGMEDIARLLADPGREMHVLDLAARRASLRTPGPGHEDGLFAPGHLGPLIDDEARRQYKMRLDDLAVEIDDAEAHADADRASQAREERAALVAHLAAAYGLGGRSRHAGDPTERARSAVTWRIRSAIRLIDRAHPALGHHLAHNVKTGTYCSYAPELSVTWSLELQG